MPDDTRLRIGAGAGYAGDRIAPAVDLARDGDLDYLVFECLAERTIALAQRRMAQGGVGYNELLEERMRRVLPPCAENDVTLVTSMGAATPAAAAERTAEIADESGLDLTVASVAGANVRDQFGAFRDETFDGEPVTAYEERAVSADAYLGVEGVVEALDAGADVVVTGRVADTSLFLAPMVHEFDWSIDPVESGPVGQGVVASHLLECAGQVTGGYYADPGRKDVQDLGDLGFPIAEVTADGEVRITKLPDAGGHVTERTCTEQLLYEVADPSEYITPDVVADFSGVELEQVAEDVVGVTGAWARQRTDTLKVNVGYDAGFVGEGELSYAGPNALARAEQAGEVVRERLAARGVEHEALRVDHVGLDSLHGEVGRERGPEPYEARVRVAARCETEAAAEDVALEVERLYTTGPAGGGGANRRVTPLVGIVSTLIPRDAVSPEVTLR